MTINAGQAARDAIALSIPVGEKLRASVGKGESVLSLRNQVRTLFATEAERVEALRLLDLVAWVKRGTNGDGDTTEPHTASGPQTRSE